MKLVTWNVNSITQRLPHLLRWLAAETPDAVLLQELKCTEDKFPLTALAAAGYTHCAVVGQKSWNGVAIVSRHPLSDVVRGLDGDDNDAQARYVEATMRGLRIGCIYLPNGNPVDSEKYPYKLAWMDRLRARAQNLLSSQTPFVMGGDFNIIPEPRDCHDPHAWADDALFRLESRKKFRALTNLGLTDALRMFNDHAETYTFWDYQAGAWPRNHGIRIDHFLLSPQTADRARTCRIDSAPRGWDTPSDHVPVVLELSNV